MTMINEDHTPSAGRFGGGGGTVALSCGAATSVGHIRADNQDAYAMVAPCYVVADGMGGLSRGEEAATLAVDAIVARWHSSLDPTDVAFAVNRDLLELVGGGGIAGTTLVACRVDESLASFISVGDSRAYLLRGPRLRQLTRDDNVRQALIRMGRPDTGMAEGLLESLTSYVGIAEDQLVAEVFSIDLCLGDRLLLCTDGLHGQVLEQRVAQLLSYKSPQSAAEALVAAADAAGGIDNATAVVLDVGDG